MEKGEGLNLKYQSLIEYENKLIDFKRRDFVDIIFLKTRCAAANRQTSTLRNIYLFQIHETFANQASTF